MRTLRPLSLAAICFLTVAVAAPIEVAATDAFEPVPVAAITTPIATGPGFQTDPHISDRFLTYTNRVDASSEVRYRDLATGADVAIPTDNSRDSWARVSGSTIVFRRVHLDAPHRAIMAFDAAAPGAGPVELSPDTTVRRTQPEIGGTTVVWLEFLPTSSIEGNVVVYDLVSHALTRLTHDGHPLGATAVSDDGKVVTWSDCSSIRSACSVWVSTREASGTWSDARLLTSGSAQHFGLDTNGQQVVFDSDGTGDINIEWMNIDGTGHRALVIPGIQADPHINGNLVSFQQEVAGSTDGDILVFDLARERMYRVTDTPTADESLHELAVAPDGRVLVATAIPDPLDDHMPDVYLHSFRLPSSGPAYSVCPLFETTKAHRVGSTVPLRLQLCDASGANLSAPSVTLTAIGLVKKDSTASTALAEDAGNANPDSAFRYDSQLGGYVYNLSTRGLSRGTWELRFKATADPATYAIHFDIR